MTGGAWYLIRGTYLTYIAPYVMALTIELDCRIMDTFVKI